MKSYTDIYTPPKGTSLTDAIAELMRRIEETGHGWYLIYRRVAISAAPGESAEQIRKRITDKGIRQCEAEIIKQHPDMAGKLDPLAERIMTRILHRDQA